MTTRKLIFKVLMGSQAYGTSTPESDCDYTEVYEEDRDQIFGLSYGEDTMSQLQKDNDDVRRYYLRHWVKMLCRGNPNALETLLVSDDQIVHASSEFSSFFLNRKHIARRPFLHKPLLIRSHLGFASGQLKRMVEGNDMGERRKTLIAKHGYDVKFAAHAYRLLAQLGCIWTEPCFGLPYHQYIRNWIMLIRSGELSLDDFRRIYNELETNVRNIIDGPCPPWIHEEEDWSEANRLLYRYYKETLL